MHGRSGARLFPLASRTAASVRTNLRRHLVQRADELRDRRLHRAHAASRAAPRATAAMASAATSLADMTGVGIAPPVITNFSLPLAKSFSTFATATGSAQMPYASGPTILSASFSNGVSGDGAAHQGVLDHPEVHARRPCLRAELRHVGRRPGRGSRPARSAWALATCFATSATTACFCFQIETQGLPPLRQTPTGPSPVRRPDGVLRSAFGRVARGSLALHRGHHLRRRSGSGVRASCTDPPAPCH